MAGIFSSWVMFPASTSSSGAAVPRWLPGCLAHCYGDTIHSVPWRCSSKYSPNPTGWWALSLLSGTLWLGQMSGSGINGGLLFEPLLYCRSCTGGFTRLTSGATAPGIQVEAVRGCWKGSWGTPVNKQCLWEPCRQYSAGHVLLATHRNNLCH